MASNARRQQRMIENWNAQAAKVRELVAERDALRSEVERLREKHEYAVGEGYCPRCGEYMPMRLDESGRVHDCDRTPPLDGLPTTIFACPVCGGHGRSRWGCWGTKENPHEHAYMRPVHELVRSRAVLAPGTEDTP